MKPKSDKAIVPNQPIASGSTHKSLWFIGQSRPTKGNPYEIQLYFIGKFLDVPTHNWAYPIMSRSVSMAMAFETKESAELYIKVLGFFDGFKPVNCLIKV